MWDLRWTKRRWGSFSPSTSVSPTNFYSTKFSILTITRGRYSRPEVADVPSGPSMDSTPRYANLKKKLALWSSDSLETLIVVNLPRKLPISWTPKAHFYLQEPGSGSYCEPFEPSIQSHSLLLRGIL
jgi:hypothetical protein